MYQNTELDTPYGLLKKEKLLKIQEAEKLVIDDPEWKNFCFAQSTTDTSCSKTKSSLSPLTIFGGLDIAAATQEEINAKFKEAIKAPSWEAMSAFYDSNVKIDNLNVTYIRSFFTLGGPLDVNGTRFTDKTDRPLE